MDRARRTGSIGIGIAAIGLAGGLLAASGCAKTLQATATEPNPMFLRTSSEDELPRSSRLSIMTRDMEMPSAFRLRNTAYFAVVSRDRLRFHVTVTHKWKEVTDIRTWDVHLEDDKGRIFRPEAKETKDNKHKTHMWDMERRSVTPPNYVGSPVLTEGQTVTQGWADQNGIAKDGYRERVPLTSVDMFKGQGDYVFHASHLFDRNVRRLTLVMRREGLEYRYTWNFK